MTGDWALRFALSGALLAFSSPAGAADLRRASLPPTYTVDLETGSVGKGGTQDLFWRAMTRSERCITQYIDNRALLAPLPAGEFNSADAARLAGLIYAQHCFSHTDSGGEVRKGFTFAVRTAEGNFAKVRVTGISARNHLDLEWRVFPPPAAARGAAASNPSLDIPRLLDHARQSLRAQRRDEAVPPLREAVALAEKLPPGARRADVLAEAGRLLWSARQPGLAESALLAAAQQMQGLPASALPADTRSMTFRMLGVVYRDQQRHAEAVPWFERAVKTDEAQPDSAATRHLNLTSNLAELAMAHCRAGSEDAAVAADRRRLDACGRARNPSSIGACRAGMRLCINGQMRETSPAQAEGKRQGW